MAKRKTKKLGRLEIRRQTARSFWEDLPLLRQIQIMDSEPIPQQTRKVEYDDDPFGDFIFDPLTNERWYEPLKKKRPRKRRYKRRIRRMRGNPAWTMKPKTILIIAGIAIGSYLAYRFMTDLSRLSRMPSTIIPQHSQLSQTPSNMFPQQSWMSQPGSTIRYSPDNKEGVFY